MSTVQCSLFTLNHVYCTVFTLHTYRTSLFMTRYFVISIMTKLGVGGCVCGGGGGLYTIHCSHSTSFFMTGILLFLCMSKLGVGGWVCVWGGGGYTPYTTHTVLPFFMTDSFYIPHCTDKIVHILAFTVYRHISRVDR